MAAPEHLRRRARYGSREGSPRKPNATAPTIGARIDAMSATKLIVRTSANADTVVPGKAFLITDATASVVAPRVITSSITVTRPLSGIRVSTRNESRCCWGLGRPPRAAKADFGNWNRSRHDRPRPASETNAVQLVSDTRCRPQRIIEQRRAARCRHEDHIRTEHLLEFGAVEVLREPTHNFGDDAGSVLLDLVAEVARVFRYRRLSARRVNQVRSEGDLRKQAGRLRHALAPATPRRRARDRPG